MKAKYDIASLHKDCLAWCESPTWKPWMVEVGLKLIETDDTFQVDHRFCDIAYLPKDYTSNNYRTFEFAQFIGLDVESYRLPEIDRDQAVRDYLAGIEEGAELVDGYIFQKDQFGMMFANGGTRGRLRLMSEGYVAEHAYTFLRLDLKEVDNG